MASKSPSTTLLRKQLTKRLRERNKRIIANWKLFQKQCASCGLRVNPNNTHLFDCDHIDPTTKKFKLSGGGARSIDKLMAELAKCQLLCSPCHASRTRTQQHFLRQPTQHQPGLFDDQ